ncbi:transcription factor [Fusarium austroafricanum]|uniref:Transcription factor n=1 Tax=Fusarium austroafricanum TaxID=2364996 RepID=A0A8H4KKX6_9HYPO|nr:transcription factor [Fusarium austroafricanum]
MSKTPTGLGESIWAINGRSRLANTHSLPQTRASSQPSVRPPPPRPPPVSAPPRNPVSIPAPTPASTSTRLTPIQAFHRFEQACQRLRWKYIDLQTSYHRALNSEEFGFTVADAERNFKVDFHEFYKWIEQALVLLLMIFKISVPEEKPQRGWNHTYHENVLIELEMLDCPVHEALGRGEVNQALRKAKELRNRWKDASEGKETPPLKMYDLNWLVGQILGGLELGYGIAAQRVQSEAAEKRSWADDYDDDEMGMAEQADDEWEWMVEPMDWEVA